MVDHARNSVTKTAASPCFEATDLAALTAELADAFRPAIEKAGLALVVDCPPSAAPAFVDRARWERIVLNLLSNAVQFTDEGRISVALHRFDDWFVLSVGDTGIGIPEDDLDAVYQRPPRHSDGHFRGRRSSPGGLVQVQDLARLHGGDAAVSSVVGWGSTFTISIPLGRDHLPPQHVRAAGRPCAMSGTAKAFVRQATALSVRKDEALLAGD